MEKRETLTAEQVMEVRKILNHSYIPTSPEFEILRRYIQSEKKDNPIFDYALMCVDAFNYGVICGKRAERAKRK